MHYFKAFRLHICLLIVADCEGLKMTEAWFEMQDKKTDFEKALFHANAIFSNPLRFIGSRDRNNFTFQPWGLRTKINVRFIRDEDGNLIEFVEVRTRRMRLAIDVRPVRIHIGLSKKEKERTIYVPYYELPHYWKSIEAENVTAN